MGSAATFFPDLTPKYGDGENQWPTENDGYYNSVKYWCNAAYEEAEYEQSKSEELKKVGEYIDYLSGKQWGTVGHRPSYKSRPVNNRMLRLFRENVGLLTDIKPMIDIRSTDPSDGSKKQAEILNKATKAWWLNSDVDMRLAMAICYAQLTTSFAKLQWNPELNYREGELEMVPMGPLSVLPLKAQFDIQGGEAVIYKSIVPLQWIRRKHPIRGGLVKPDIQYSTYQLEQTPPPGLPPMLYSMMSEGMKRTVGGAPRFVNSAFPMALYREFWLKDWTQNSSNREVSMGANNWRYVVKPGGFLYPRGRLIVMGGTEIMHDGPNPYWHGKFPFSMLRLNIVPWQIYGLSTLRSQLDLQDIINNILAGVMDMIKKAVNPSFFAPKNAFSEQVWQSLDFSKPGERAAYSQNAVHKPEFVPAPQLPGYVLQFHNIIEKEMDQNSGGSLTNELSKKKQIPGNDGIENMKNLQQTPIRMEGRNIEIFLRDCGQLHVPNMMQFYTLKKRMYMLGTKGATFEDFDWDPGTMVPAGTPPEEHLRKFQFMIEPGSLLSIKRVEDQMKLYRLRQGGDLDRRTMYEMMDLNIDVDQVEKRLKQERSDPSLAPAPMKKGRK